MKPSAAIDTSSLVFAFKHREIEALLRKKYSCLVLPTAVYKEAILEGKKQGFPEVDEIEAAITEGYVKIEPAPNPPNKPQTSLGKGELEAIALAAKKSIDLLSDDKKAATAAKLMRVNAIPLTALIVAAARQGVLSKKTALTTLDELVISGYRLKSDVYIKLANEIKKE